MAANLSYFLMQVIVRKKIKFNFNLHAIFEY